jgi:hypothetical protein
VFDVTAVSSVPLSLSELRQREDEVFEVTLGSSEEMRCGREGEVFEVTLGSCPAFP